MVFAFGLSNDAKKLFNAFLEPFTLFFGAFPSEKYLRISPLVPTRVTSAFFFCSYQRKQLFGFLECSLTSP